MAGEIWFCAHCGKEQPVRKEWKGPSNRVFCTVCNRNVGESGSHTPTTAERWKADTETSRLVESIISKRIVSARRVVCSRPYSQDIVIEMDDGTIVSFCGQHADTIMREGDHTRK